MSNYNWSTFTTRIAVHASIEKLYWCWAAKEGIESWFLRLSEYKKPDGTLLTNNEYAEKGDQFKWLWHGWPDEVSEQGTIINCNGTDFFKFSFGKAGDCTVSIYDEEGQMIVELMQENIPDDEHGKQQWHVGCKTGWTFYLTNLKSLLEGGIDLRNRNTFLKNVINS